MNRTRVWRSPTPVRLGAAVIAILGGAATDSRAATYADAVMGERPIAYWRLNESNSIAPAEAINLGSLGPAGNGVYWNAPARQQPGGGLRAFLRAVLQVLQGIQR